MTDSSSPHQGPAASPFDSRDLEDLAVRGIAAEAALAQLRLCTAPPPAIRLLRPCSPGDGIRVLSNEEAAALAAAYDAACSSLDVAKFVPASGAASRMFRALLAVLARSGEGGPRTRAALEEAARGGDRDAGDVLAFLDGLADFAFHDALAAELQRRGKNLAEAARSDVPAVLAVLLLEDGLGYASLPKGLLAFHREDGEIRTAFEEHLVEAAAYARGEGGLCRLHFTVSPEHEARFLAVLEEVRARNQARFGVRYEVEFSQQEPSTDSIAADLEGGPFRSRHRRLLFRPAGHGALLGNLARVDADLLFVKNIDNVSVRGLLDITALWKRALAGVLLELRGRIVRARRAIEDGEEGAVRAALELLREELGVEEPVDAEGEELAAFAAGQLDRPLRVCGMVAADSNPGGGPYWVLGHDGRASAQIVEAAQVDRGDAAQVAILESARHFNPVDLVCATRDWQGRAFDLDRFVDREAVFIAEKSQDGRPLRSLERPGLWNGAMAGWNTVFVEVPAETFQPVKSVNDLLAPAHQCCKDPMP